MKSSYMNEKHSFSYTATQFQTVIYASPTNINVGDSVG